MAAVPRDFPARERGELDVRLDRALPASIVAGRVSALFCAGTCFHTRQGVADLRIVVGATRHAADAWRMPRPDRFRETGEPRAYRSGFWATVLVEAPDQPGSLKVAVEGVLKDGTVETASLGTIEVTAPPKAAGVAALPAGTPSIAICMATYNPEPDLLHIQIDSIRAQTEKDWICLISDDCSDQARFDVIAAAVAGDPRFVLTRGDRRLGFYRNFERALSMVPHTVEFIALSDQDDRWYPEKLATLRQAIGSAELVYSDLRRVDDAGRVRSETLWEDRHNNHRNLASLLISNTIVGAACLFRRRVADHALPFPQGPGWYFHDQWIGLVAMALGRVEYVDKALYDYVQHPAAVLGHVAQKEAGTDRRPSVTMRFRQWFDVNGHWRAAYFSLYLQRRLLARVLLARCEGRLTPRKRRALRLLVSAARSPLALAWLAARPARALVGRNETLGGEAELVKGILWRHLTALRARGRSSLGRHPADASMPRFEPQALGARQRRWLVRS